MKYPAYLRNKMQLKGKNRAEKAIQKKGGGRLDLTGAQSMSDIKYLVMYS